jgi:dephospho-CoA kinase
MFAGKPVIGVAGGIGSGKSFVARLFGELGAMVISSDELIKEAYADEEVRQAVRRQWGEQFLRPDGSVDREKVSGRIFTDPQARQWLEGLLHPRVARRRQELMEQRADDPQVLAYVWDTPLLFETGLNSQCDRVVFVDAPDAVRLQRVRQNRGWDASELRRRENLQLPLDRKREMSDHVISNAADADFARMQVAEVLSRICNDVL